MVIGGKVRSMSGVKSKWGIDMKVGDLVINQYSGIGIVTAYNTGGWWVTYSDGQMGFCCESDLEVINESR